MSRTKTTARGRNRHRLGSLAAAVLAAATIGVTALPASADMTEPAGNLVKNWSFETPSVAAYTTRSFSAPAQLGTSVLQCGYRGFPPQLTCSSVFQGWKVTRGTVDVSGASFWQTAAGAQSIDLNSKELAARIEQIVPVRANQCYSLRFKVAATPGINGGVPLDVKIEEIGVTPPPPLTQHYDLNTAGRTRTNMGYASKTIAFMASSGTSSVRVSFAGGDDGEFGASSTQGPVLDAVSLVGQNCLI